MDTFDPRPDLERDRTANKPTDDHTEADRETRPGDPNSSTHARSTNERRPGSFGRRPFLYGVVGAGTLGFLSRPVAARPNEVVKLVGDTGGAGDAMGRSVEIQGTTLFVGAGNDDDNGPKAGATYVFNKSDSGWKRSQKLLASDGNGDDGFGHDIAVSGNTAMIGAVFDDQRGFNAGATYVFERDSDAGTWTEREKVIPDSLNSNDFFGISVDVEGTTALITARSEEDLVPDGGSAYIYERQPGGWTQTAKLFPNDPAPWDWFGTYADLSGGTAVIGAPRKQNFTGAVYVFERSADWAQTAKLLPDDPPEQGDQFGWRTSILGDLIAVGARKDGVRETDAGAVYLFRKSDNCWIQEARLFGDDTAAGDEFGSSISLNGRRLLVGAPRADGNSTNSGKAYLFGKRGNQWVQLREFMAFDGATGDRFGDSVVLHGNIAAIGTPFDDNSNGTRAGAAYVFRV